MLGDNAHASFGSQQGSITAAIFPCSSTGDQYMSISVTEGIPFTFTYSMVAGAGSGVEGASDYEFAFADAYDTGYLSISGVDYTSASGFIYPTSLPVDAPEPSSLITLMG